MLGPGSPAERMTAASLGVYRQPMAHDVWEQDYKVLDAAVTYFTFTSPQGPANADEVARVLGEVSEDWDVSVAR